MIWKYIVVHGINNLIFKKIIYQKNNKQNVLFKYFKRSIIKLQLNNYFFQLNNNSKYTMNISYCQTIDTL